MSEPTDVVERARQALDGITPGEWRKDSSTRTNAYVRRWPSAKPTAHAAYGEVIAGNLTHADARFVAAAPELVADLTAEVETLRAAQAWAAWFAAERDDVAETLEASESAHIHAVRIHSLSIKQDAAELDRLTAERDEARATLDRVRDEIQFLAARDQILIRAALDGEVQQ